MVRRLFRLFGLLAVVLFILGVFTLYAAPGFMLPERARVLAEALPSLAPRKPVVLEPQAEEIQAGPTINRMTNTPRKKPVESAEQTSAKPAESEPTPKSLPVAQRKTIRVGE